MRYAFAGNRIIAYKILEYIIEQGYKPSAIMLVENSEISIKIQNLIDIEEKFIFIGKNSINSMTASILKQLELDYIICIHYPFILPKEFVDIPKIGAINLHPSYLPFNRGWHTPTWAIKNNTIYGATLHFITEGVDQGDIIFQKEIKILPTDTADSLYARVLKLEQDVFADAFPMIKSLNPIRRKQCIDKGDFHIKKDLQKMQKIEMDESVTYREAINQFRALTTNDINEAAFFMVDNRKYAIQIKIEEIL